MISLPIEFENRMKDMLGSEYDELLKFTLSLVIT